MAWAVFSNVVSVGEESLHRSMNNLVSAFGGDGLTGLPMVGPGAGKALCFEAIY